MTSNYRAPEDAVPTPAQMIANGMPPEIANAPDTPDRGVAIAEWLMSEYRNGNRSRG